MKNIADALKVLGIAKKEAAELADRWPVRTADIPGLVEDISESVADAGAVYVADWRGDPYGLLAHAAGAAKARGSEVAIDQEEHRPSIDFGGKYFIWQGSTQFDHLVLAASWNAVVGKKLELRTLEFWNNSDTLIFVALPPAEWKKVGKALQPLTKKLFADVKGKSRFAAAPRPPLQQVDWNKLVAKLIPWYAKPDAVDLATRGKHKFSVAQLGKDRETRLKLALQVPPLKRETRALKDDTIREVDRAFECLCGEFLGSYRSGFFAPLSRWFVERNSADLATCLYARSLLAHLQALWEVYYWRWRPVSDSRAGEYIPDYSLFPVHVAWAWFTLSALGCEQEAAAIASLLQEPVFGKNGFRDFENKERGWLALARYLAGGVKSPDLAYVDAVLPLCAAKGWKDQAALVKGLQVNARSGGESAESDEPHYSLWPAPYYALARRLKVDVSRFGNPFLSQPVTREEIRFDVPLIKQLQGALASFKKLKRSAFRGLQPDAMTPPRAAELQAKIKALRKRGDDVVACECDSVYLIQNLEKKVRGGMKTATCVVCNARFFSSSHDFTCQMLIEERSQF
jgi:hypothetical protein